MPAQLRRLLQNPVGDALKYRREEAPYIHVFARPIEPGSRLPPTAPAEGWLIGVKDNGIGIDARYHDKVFQLFSSACTDGGLSNPGSGHETGWRWNSTQIVHWHRVPRWGH